MRIAMLAPIAWRTPPRRYGPWEQVVSLLTEGLVARGLDVTLFATVDSLTTAKLRPTVPVGYEEEPTVNRRVWESLHIAAVFEAAPEFDLIHNHFDFLPLSYAGLVTTQVLTTIHGFSSPSILPVFQKYDGRVAYVSISNADRHPSLHYRATVYHGIDLKQFTLRTAPDDYLLFFGRIHHDKGTREAIDIARRAGRRLLLAGPIQDQAYFDTAIAPHLDGHQTVYMGNVGPDKRDKLLGGAIALLHPINFDEPFGLSVIEAMACGTPVIAFRRGSMPEVIVDGVTGWVVDSTEEAAATVARLASIDRRACRQHVAARFSAQRMVDDYVRVYDQLLAAPPALSGSAKSRGID